MYKIDQGHIDIILSSTIRGHRKFNNNLTARQFASTYKKILALVE